VIGAGDSAPSFLELLSFVAARLPPATISLEMRPKRTTSFGLDVPPRAKTKARRYLFLLILPGLAVYFFLPACVSDHLKSQNSVPRTFYRRTTAKLCAQRVSTADRRRAGIRPHFHTRRGTHDSGRKQCRHSRGWGARNGRHDVSMASPPRCERRSRGSWRRAARFLEQHFTGHSVPRRAHDNHSSKEIPRLLVAGFTLVLLIPGTFLLAWFMEKD
jgi:hypothetical protein